MFAKGTPIIKKNTHPNKGGQFRRGCHACSKLSFSLQQSRKSTIDQIPHYLFGHTVEGRKIRSHRFETMVEARVCWCFQQNHTLQSFFGAFHGFRNHPRYVWAFRHTWPWVSTRPATSVWKCASLGDVWLTRMHRSR